ncbi:MAG: DUF4440 domain-containing protein [Balneolaceae bacterium]
MKTIYKTSLITSVLVAILTLVGFSGLNESAIDHPNEADKKAVEARNAVFMETYKNMDAAGMAELYTSDGKLLPPNSLTISGKENLQSYWQAVMDMGISEIVLFTGDVERHGQVLVEVSSADLKAEDGTVLDQAKYIVIWKQEKGDWKMYLDIFNSNIAPSNE